MTVPRGIILYDSVCILCSRWTRFVIKRDSQALFTFMPIQGGKGRVLAQSLGIDPDEPESFALILNDKPYFKSAAVIKIVRQLRGWGWTSGFRYLPRAWLDWIYDRIARNRYKIFGKADSCILPDASMRARFEDLESAIVKTSKRER